MAVKGRRTYSRSLQEAAAELGRPVEDITPVDLLEYEHENLPAGHQSPLGGEVTSVPLITRPEAETRRLATIGRAAVEAAVAKRKPAR